MKTEFIVLAAGKGKRTLSDLPKVLLPLGGRPMLFGIIAQLAGFKDARINLVIGHGAKQVKQQVENFRAQLKLPSGKIRYIEQRQQLGTGHAVSSAMRGLDAQDLAVVMYGDVPLLSTETIKSIIGAAQVTGQGKTKQRGVVASEPQAVWLAAKLMDPTGYGRIVRNTFGKPVGIVEEKDCTPEQRKIKEINTGIMAAPISSIRPWLRKLMQSKPRNAQGEYLLTDLMQLAHSQEHRMVILQAKDREEFLGANDMWQLSQLERILQKRRAKRLAEKGVYLMDPARLDILGEVKTGKGVRIGANVLFKGEVKLGDNVTIGSNCVIDNSSIGKDTEIKDFSHIQASKIGAACAVGPYARLRPGSALADQVKLGNFVEIKQSRLGDAAQVSHLSYIGDAKLGKQVNIGAGVITCNYDGIAKHQTLIGDDAFIGSNTSLVAPVKLGKQAIVGAGSAISKDVPDGSLGIARAPQRNLPKIGRVRRTAAAKSKAAKLKQGQNKQKK